MQRMQKPTAIRGEKQRRPRTRPPPLEPRLKKAFTATLRAASVERAWFEYKPMMAERQIAHAKRYGFLVEVKDVPGKIRIVQANGLSGVQHALLTPKCRALLKVIANMFSQAQAGQGLEPKFLSITSMTRDRKRQKQLREAGYPAAEKSTHGLGEAFDINVKWFKENSPRHFQVLKAILDKLHTSRRINLIDETAINGALHVARNPHW